MIVDTLGVGVLRRVLGFADLLERGGESLVSVVLPQLLKPSNPFAKCGFSRAVGSEA